MDWFLWLKWHNACKCPRTEGQLFLSCPEGGRRTRPRAQAFEGRGRPETGSQSPGVWAKRSPLPSFREMTDTVTAPATLTLTLTDQEGRAIGGTVTKAWEAVADHVVLSCPFGDQLCRQERAKHRPLCFSKTEESRSKER